MANINPPIKTKVEMYRLVEYNEDDNDFVKYPDSWPPFRNGSIVCTMLQGPCDCGAWHKLTEWIPRSEEHKVKDL